MTHPIFFEPTNTNVTKYKILNLLSHYSSKQFSMTKIWISNANIVAPENRADSISCGRQFWAKTLDSLPESILLKIHVFLKICFDKQNLSELF
jgi:hypothetical protein